MLFEVKSAERADETRPRPRGADGQIVSVRNIQGTRPCPRLLRRERRRPVEPRHKIGDCNEPAVGEVLKQTRHCTRLGLRNQRRANGKDASPPRNRSRAVLIRPGNERLLIASLANLRGLRAGRRHRTRIVRTRRIRERQRCPTRAHCAPNHAHELVATRLSTRNSTQSAGITPRRQVAARNRPHPDWDELAVIAPPESSSKNGNG